ncbi:PKD domain-containing protein, partial [Cribrihabitans sp. XS_ASV171]
LEVRRKVVVNAAPEPAMDLAGEVAVGQAVRFDAGGSTDPDGAIIRFDWDFGDGETGREVQTTHRYAEPGDYIVTLRVTDDAGVGNSVAELTRTIRVNPAPVAGLASGGAVCPRRELHFSASAGEGVAVSWFFGDGAAGQGPEVSHAFARPGLYPVQVVMDDGQGLPSSRRAEETYVRVNAAPTALAGPDRVVCPGEPVVFDAGASGDLDGDLRGWSWEFSDGVTLEGARVERVFDAPADLRVRLRVRDDSGAEGCDIGTDDARVLVNAPPVVDAGPDREIPVGAAHDVLRLEAGELSDPDGQGVRVSWSLGDGTEAAGAVVRHQYADPGSYTVTVRAQDSTGLACGIATDSATITALPRE